jgi:hypothetical protein
MQKPVQNKLNTLIGHSGNSDVDLVVNIDIDTKAIAYSILCSLHAKGELNEQELENAIQKLDSLIERDKKKQKERDQFIENRSRIHEFPQQNTRRRWF